MHVVEVLHKLITEKRVKRDEIGVVVPYTGQRKFIAGVLAEDFLLNHEGLIAQEEDDANSMEFPRLIRKKKVLI